jgi:methenyltetrahydrofolate cyclohydrolase
MTSLWDQTLGAFRDAVASDAPTPGGGSVAMVSATMGLGLVVMALEITRKKQRSGPETDERDALLTRCRQELVVLSRHANEDVQVFNDYMAALRLPKGTPEDKASRKQAMQKALVRATRAPLAAAMSAVFALEAADHAASLAGDQVVSDVGAGASLLGGAVAAVLLNVDINLAGVADPELKESFATERADLAARATALTTAVLEKVCGRMSAGK